jgi:chorismate dehydratase
VKLRIGRISYLNLLPIFRTLELERDCSGYEFVDGYPSALNAMLREGRIDVSPSSSIEYLRRPGDYYLIDGHSISSMGAIESILLFSRVPLNELGGREIFVTNQSETSTALLEVILRKFDGLDCSISVSGMPFDEAIRCHLAFLAIGDEALKALYTSQGVKEECLRPGCTFRLVGSERYFVYDLGEVWYERTGLPFVFALWIARKDLPDSKKTLLEKLVRDLDFAKEESSRRFAELASGVDFAMPAEDIVKYWKRISYDLTGRHREGLELFRSYLAELGLLMRE